MRRINQEIPCNAWDPGNLLPQREKRSRGKNAGASRMLYERFQGLIIYMGGECCGNGSAPIRGEA